MTQAIAATPIRRHRRAMNRNERIEWSISRCYQYRASHANPAAIGLDHRDRNAATFAA